MEIWKSIPSLPGYEASSMGRIRSERFKKPLKTDRKISNGGYLMFGVNGGKTLNVHRCVAIAWIPKIDGKDYVNHKNGDRKDNRIENLEWVTPSGNTLHGYARGSFKGIRKSRGKDHWCAKVAHLDQSTLDSIRHLLEKKEFSQTAIGKMFKLSQQTISRIKASMRNY